MPWKNDDTYMSVLWNWDNVLSSSSAVVVEVMEELRWYSLVHDDTDSVVQQTLSKDDGVQLRIDLILREYAQDSNGVRSAERRAEDQTLK